MNLFSSATTLAHMIRNREISPVEVVTEYAAHIDRKNPEVNAYVWRNEEQAVEQARLAEQQVLAGETTQPFLGVPVPIKNLSDVTGQPNDQCSLAIDDSPREETDPAVQRLIDGGFTLQGRTNSPEFGPLTVSQNRKYGATANPWNLQRTAGGSSGGAAAAVASGMAPVAHASDGGGSIRVPSSCCGLVGLKPSRGRIPQAVAGWEHSTTEGAITRTMEDAAGLLDVMSGPDLAAWYSAPEPVEPYTHSYLRDPGTLRIGLMLTPPTGLPVDDACLEATHAAAEALRSVGHTVVDATPRLYSAQSIEDFQIIISAWTGANDVADESLLDTYIRERIQQGRSYDATQYAAASARIQLETRDILPQWGQNFDVLLTPTMATTVPDLTVVYDEANTASLAERTTELRMISFTSFVNMSGQPAISLPVHQDADGLPVGVQLVGGAFREDVLLQLGRQLEQHFQWQHTLASLQTGIKA